MPPAPKTAEKPANAAKAAKPDEAKKVLDPKDQLSKYLTSTKADHFNLEERAERYVLSSGSLGMDIEGVVFPPGIYRVGGGPNLGKTPFLIGLVDDLLDKVPNSRVVWALAEGRMSDQNLARFKHKVVWRAEDWEVGTVFIFKCNTFETWINMKRELVANNPTGCRYGFVTDSIDNMILKDDMVKEFSEASKVAGTPAMSKRLFQKMGLAMRERGHWAFFVSQRTAAIKLDPYAKTEHRQTEGSGGNALAHNADEVLEFMEWFESDLILKDPNEKLSRTNPALGHNLRIKVKKSSNEKRFLTLEIPIKHGVAGDSAIWREREIGDAMLMWQLVSKVNPVAAAKEGASAKAGDAKGKGGSWLYFSPSLVAEMTDKGLPELPTDKDGNVKVQGMNQLYDLLGERKDVADYLYAQFRQRIGGAST